jgi:hypothetical protein
VTQPVPSPSLQAASPIHGVAPARPRDAAPDGGVAFQALLDELGSRAESLEQRSRAELSQDELAGALDEARTSLEQMLSLKDRLLEAWRASQQAGPADSGAPRT